MTNPVEVLFCGRRIVTFSKATDFVFNTKDKYVKNYSEGDNNIFLNFDHILCVGFKDTI